MYKLLICLVIFLFTEEVLIAQDSQVDSSLVFQELKDLDSLLFSVGFNRCDTVQFRNLLSDDFEFYHDENGLLESKEKFISNMPNLCKMNYKPIRELLDNSLEAFPLYSNGRLYGAVQTGVHLFYGLEKGRPRYLTSKAKFTHVWIIEMGEWRLKRILSYDHENVN